MIARFDDGDAYRSARRRDSLAALRVSQRFGESSECPFTFIDLPTTLRDQNPALSTRAATGPLLISFTVRASRDLRWR